MSSVRWSESELDAFIARTGAKVAASFGHARANGDGMPTAPRKASPGRLAAYPEQGSEQLAPTDRSSPVESSATRRIRLATESLANCALACTLVGSDSYELAFDGARLLGVNDLYAVSHYRRVAYRRAWHEAVRRCLETAPARSWLNDAHWAPLDHFRVVGYRQSARLCDLDALSGQFKAAIDGLRRAGLIVDDDPQHFIDMRSAQAIGTYKVVIRVEPVSRGTHALSRLSCSTVSGSHHAPSDPLKDPTTEGGLV